MSPDFNNCQHRLTFSQFDLPCWLVFFPFIQGEPAVPIRLARFLIHDPLLWQEYTDPVIRNAAYSLTFSSITLTSSFENMSPASRRCTASSVPSSRRCPSATWTAANPAAGLPASAVLCEGKIAC